MYSDSKIHHKQYKYKCYKCGNIEFKKLKAKHKKRGGKNGFIQKEETTRDTNGRG